MRSTLYRIARAIGDAKAITRGPRPIVKRIERRTLGRLFSRIISKVVGR